MISCRQQYTSAKQTEPRLTKLRGFIVLYVEVKVFVTSFVGPTPKIGSNMALIAAEGFVIVVVVL